MANTTPVSQKDFEALQTGDLIDHPPHTGLRFVRFRNGKATCVNEETGQRVNIVFPVTRITTPTPEGSTPSIPVPVTEDET